MNETDIEIFVLLDRLREAIIRAREAGRTPTSVWLDRPAYSTVVAVKQFEISRGIRPTIFGLELVESKLDSDDGFEVR